MFRKSKNTEHKLSEALMEVITRYPALVPEATAMMDAWVRAEGRDPEEEKKQAAFDAVRGFRASDFY